MPDAAPNGTSDDSANDNITDRDTNRDTIALADHPTPTKIDVFIIDDEPRNLSYYQAIINREARIRCIGSTTNGESATAIVVTSRPDLVLVDYALYPVSGFQVMETIRVELPDMPIILLGGRALLQERSLAAGASAYIPMPITPRKLIDTIIAVHQEKVSGA